MYQWQIAMKSYTHICFAYGFPFRKTDHLLTHIDELNGKGFKFNFVLFFVPEIHGKKKQVDLLSFVSSFEIALMPLKVSTCANELEPRIGAYRWYVDVIVFATLRLNFEAHTFQSKGSTSVSKREVSSWIIDWTRFDETSIWFFFKKNKTNTGWKDKIKFYTLKYWNVWEYFYLSKKKCHN